jgi:probable selenium-dependent hydroxylase accessory protein YqeC
MGLLDGLNLDTGERELVCLIGAGGKTSVMFSLAATLKARGKKVLVTTTTKIYQPEKTQCDEMILESQGLAGLYEKNRPGTVICLGKALNEKENKVIGIETESVDRLFDENLFDWILVEGDGAARKAIKAPNENEPVVPGRTTLALGLVGLDVLGRPVTADTVHRCALFLNVTGSTENEPIDEMAVAKLIFSSQGLFKNVPPGARKMALLNKSDLMPDGNPDPVRRIRHMVEKSTPGIPVSAISASMDRVMPW